jgi:integrase
MTRRGHNEGSVYKRDDGRWAGVISVNGKRKFIYGKTKQDAQRKMNIALRDLQAGLPIVSEKQTLEQFLVSWLDMIKPTIEESTWKRHRQYCEIHIIPNLGRVKLSALTPQQVQEFYSDRLASGLASTTVNHLHDTLHKALKRAMRLGLLARNVTELVDVPRVDPAEMHPLTREETHILFDVASGDRLEALYVLAVATGMRQSELLGLRWPDVDFDSGVIRVRNQLKRRIDKRWVFQEPKTRRSRRQIALAAPALAALKRHLERQDAEREHIGASWRPHDLIFCSQQGMPLIARNVYRSFKELLKRGALPDIRFHDLRHTCATLLLIARVNPKVVSEMLGHASVSITLDIYSHVIPDMQQDAAAIMAAVLEWSPDVL